MSTHNELNKTLEELRVAANHTSHPEVYTQIAHLPKFLIENFDTLPSREHANGALTPPLPYPSILLAAQAVATNADRQIRTLLVIHAHTSDTHIYLDAMMDGSIHLGLARAPITEYLGDLSFEATDERNAAAWTNITDLFIKFLALLSAENVTASPPASSFSRKRELARIKAGKHVVSYHVHRLTIRRPSHTSQPTQPGPAKRSHWRRAHLRHYTAGVGHIKKTKTIAIAPCFVSGPGFIDKDYII